MLKKIISLLTGSKKETPAPLSPTVAKKKPQEPIAAAPNPSQKAAKSEPPIQVLKPETAAPHQSPAESKADRPVTSEVTTKHIDYSKFIHLSEKYIRVTDPHGELERLPDNFFDAYEKLESVYLYLTKVQDLPASLSRLTTLTGLEINCPKLKQLPALIAGFKNLQHLNIHCPQMRVEEQFLKFTQLNNLIRLTLSGYYGNKWPAILEKLTQLRYLNITIDSKKTDQLEMIRSIGKMKWLKEVSFRGALNLEQIGDEIIALDHLESASLWDTNPVNRPEFLNWGLLRHVSFRLPYKAGEMTFDDFKVAIQSDKFDDNARRLLFGFFAKQYNAIKELLPNLLLTAAHDKGQEAILFFEYKPVKTLLERLRELSSKANIRVAAKVELNCYHIIGKENSFEQILELVRHGKSLLLEDHVKEWLTALEDPWLRQTESEEANEQVYRLLTSNQAENYLLAFQIIDGGGANDELVSVVAAVMLSHPDQKVAKAAEKLFAKVGPSNALAIFKQKKISFRKSGETVKTLNRLFQTDIGILAIPFRLMHGLIAGENPVIKDVLPGELSFKDCQFNEPFPACARFFEHFTSVDFSRSKGLDVAVALRNMAHWPALRRLDFSGCHYQLPASIGDFTQLTHLDLASNTLEDASMLTTMTNLVELSVEGCKIKSWQWLGSLENLETLNLGRNELTALPNELAGMTGLRSLSVSQNKLKTVGEVLFSHYALYNLDLSNNLISELDYRFFSKLPLDKLSLRSNKISEFDPARFLAATGGRPCGVWELNLASNALTAFKVEKNMFSRLSVLDISKNKITELDDGIFQFTGVKNLFASENQIAAIPPSIAGKYLQKLFLGKNQLTELPEYFSTTRVENCDLRYNKIEAIPDSFKRKDKDDYSKVYWKLEGNPMGLYSLI